MFDKITSDDTAGKGNVGQPDTPALTTTEMQEQMDSLPNLIIEKYNELIDGLNDTTAAGNIGMAIPSGVNTTQATIQGVVYAMVLDWSLNTQNRHNHSNKAVLDGITQDALNSYSALVSLLTGISSITTTISNNSAALPTDKAVHDFVENYDIRAKILAAAYPVGCVYSTKGASPTAVFGGTWSLIDTDAQGVSRYQRTA